jgi:hypothetical protein
MQNANFLEHTSRLNLLRCGLVTLLKWAATFPGFRYAASRLRYGRDLCGFAYFTFENICVTACTIKTTAVAWMQRSGIRGATPRESTIINVFHHWRKSQLIYALLALAFTTQAAAHGDEDHRHDEPAPVMATPSSNANRPQRLADGSLFIPKPVQRLMRLRTQLAIVETLAITQTFNGKVIADPNASGRVQAIQSGRIEAGPEGLPTLGQRVNKGETLAWLKPLARSLERADQHARLAELDAGVAIAQARVARLDQLEGAVAQKEIDTARLELAALQRQRAAIGTSLSTAEALTAPISGVVVAAHVVPGQVVEAREMLFEIIDPARLLVEALAYQAVPTASFTQASAQFLGGNTPLRFMGAGQQLREQELPLLFRVVSADANLAIGQQVKVIAQTTGKIEGVAVAQTALVKNASGEMMVWLHTGAEIFQPHVVKMSPLNANTAVITSGLQAGDRIVTEGASLLGQIR